MDKTEEFNLGVKRGTEISVLSELLIDSEKMKDVEKLLKPDEFLIPEHRLIYSTMVSLYQKTKGYDSQTVIDKLKENGKLEDAGGEDYISGMIPTLPINLEYKISQIKESAKRQELQKKLLRYIDNTESGEYDYSAIIENIHQDISKRRIDIEKENLESLDRVYSFNDLENDIIKTPEGLKTGFTELDKIIRIKPGTITIIGARPSHGKTTLMMNMLLNMLEEYKDKVFYFFSYEEARKRIGIKLLMNLSRKIINPHQNIQQYEWYIRGKNTNDEEIEKGKKTFKNYTQSERLKIIDEPLFVDELSNYLEYASRQHDIGAVFIDYIQKVKISGKYGTRQIEIQKISETILETANRLSLPVILGAQLGRDKEHRNKVRLDNLREAGDIEQDANIVLGLFNSVMEKAQEEGQLTNQTAENPEIITLDVTILKNRDGGNINDKKELQFNPPILKISDVAIPSALDRMRKK